MLALAQPQNPMLRPAAYSAWFRFLVLGALATPVARAAGYSAERFVQGADVSGLAVLEAGGAVYRDSKNRIQPDALTALRGTGVSCFRLRLFLSPDGKGLVTNDLAYTLALARRVKASGAALMLDLHYSDTWADPAKQFKPAAWEKLPFDELVGAVREYTRLTLARFFAEGVAPDYLQIGNEITNGMLWPDGRVEFGEAHDEQAWTRLARLLRAGFEGVDSAVTAAKAARPKTILHIESTGNVVRTTWWLNHARDAALPFDIVGLSYYPEWHGSLASLRETLGAVARDFQVPVMIVETAYPWKHDEHWNGKKNLDWPLTPDGQRRFLADVVETVRSIPGGLGAGVCWWHPESIQLRGQRAWIGGSCALFDDEGRLLPAAGAFQPSEEKR